RHPLYVKVNQKIARVVDSMAELEYVRSVDEFQVALGGKTASLDQALSLARQIKKAIATQVGLVPSKLQKWQNFRNCTLS
ncbi:hypothetical protein, partial [Pseudovibrio sp. Ad46]|uniref:hypothetical protein n=1 Tax=Pseudovibrio sp. Ad46 TaxID=989432 RepID=UPI000B0E3089